MKGIVRKLAIGKGESTLFIEYEEFSKVLLDWITKEIPLCKEDWNLGINSINKSVDFEIIQIGIGPYTEGNEIHYSDTEKFGKIITYENTWDSVFKFCDTFPQHSLEESLRQFFKVPEKL